MYDTKNSRKRKLQAERMNYALKEIEKAGFEIWDFNEVKLEFIFENEMIYFYPYSGWYSGKSIKDGRGIKKLLNQIT